MENRKDSNKRELIVQLQGNEVQAARSAIKKIRKTGKLEDIPGIIEALRKQDKDTIKKEIQTLLCDIQMDGAAEVIANAIKDPDNNTILSELLSICWESKLDFTQYLDVFVSSFINAEYNTSIEAFTVIEKIFVDYDIPASKLNKTIKQIKMSYPNITESKQELALVLLDTLESQIKTQEN